MKVIDQNQVFRKFDFSSVITAADNQEACEIIKGIIADGNYFTNSPKFQTKENIFSRQMQNKKSRYCISRCGS